MTGTVGSSRSSWTLADWERRLCRGSGQPSHRFIEAEMEGLDGPVRRYLTHAIPPRTPLYRCGRLDMRGSIKLGRWLPFRARQILCPHHGFMWAARRRRYRRLR